MCFIHIIKLSKKTVFQPQCIDLTFSQRVCWVSQPKNSSRRAISLTQPFGWTRIKRVNRGGSNTLSTSSSYSLFPSKIYIRMKKKQNSIDMNEWLSWNPSRTCAGHISPQNQKKERIILIIFDYYDKMKPILGLSHLFFPYKQSIIGSNQKLIWSPANPLIFFILHVHKNAHTFEFCGEMCLVIQKITQ